MHAFKKPTNAISNPVYSNYTLQWAVIEVKHVHTCYASFVAIYMWSDYQFAKTKGIDFEIKIIAERLSTF